MAEAPVSLSIPSTLESGQMTRKKDEPVALRYFQATVKVGLGRIGPCACRARWLEGVAVSHAGGRNASRSFGGARVFSRNQPGGSICFFAAHGRLGRAQVEPMDATPDLTLINGDPGQNEATSVRGGEETARRPGRRETMITDSGE